MTMKKGIGYVQLPDGLVKVNSKGKNDPNSSKLDNCTKSVSIVNAIMMFKALCKKPSFEPLYNAI
jgi:hypothetical protein